MSREKTPPGPTTESISAARTRPGSFFRAAVLGAVTALAPAAGCYVSDPAYAVPDAATDADAHDGDVAADDGSAESAPVYAVPDYGTEDYGAPVYGVP